LKNSVTGKDAGRAVTTTIRVGEEEFRTLPFVEKRTYLDGLLPKEKLALILGDADDKKLARVMQPHELYWLFKEDGGPDAMELLALANPEQCVFILDMELWRGWSFQEDKAVEYLGYILQGSEEHFLELLPIWISISSPFFWGESLLSRGASVISIPMKNVRPIGTTPLTMCF
jgi:hypothetical protein